MGSLASFLQGGSTTTTKKKGNSLTSFLSAEQIAPPAIQQDIPTNTETFKTKDGNTAYKTPSGSIHELLPDGTKKVTIAPQFGGGVYLIDPKNTGNVINKGHTTYGGVEAKSGMNRDDIVPVSLGGVNTDSSNINLVPKSQNPAEFETKLAKEVKEGKISKQQAQVQILSYKQNKDLKQTVLGNFIPSLGSTLADFARGLAKPFVETGVSVVNAGRSLQSAGKAIVKGEKTAQDYTQKSYNIPGYGEAKPLLTGSETPVETLKKTTGTALEIAPYFIGLPEVKGLQNTLKVIGSKPIQELTSKEIANFTKAYAKKLLISSSTLGTMFGTGQTLTEDIPQDKNFFKELGSNILKSTATVALMETTLAPVLQKLMVKNSAKTLNEIVKDAHTVAPEPKIENVEVPGVGKLPKEISFESSKNVDPEILKNYKLKKVDGVVNYQIKSMVKAKASSRVAESIQAKALEDEMLKTGFNELAGYDPVTIKDQAKRVSELLTKDLNKAKAMARGEIKLPINIREASLIKGLEDYATMKGDVNLMRDLAKSPLVAETSRHAQELRILAERNPESGVGQIINLLKAREATFVRKTGRTIKEAKATEIKSIRQELSKVSPTKKDWGSFIDQLKCT